MGERHEVCLYEICVFYLCDQLLPLVGHWTDTLDAVLKRDSRSISKLISCVGYTASSAVQVEAIRLTHFLAARQPTLADTLVRQKLTAGEKQYLPHCCKCLYQGI